jgi:hypothetical protein
VKQGCESEQFIAINDYMEMVARVFKWEMRGREQDSGETEKRGY